MTMLRSDDSVVSIPVPGVAGLALVYHCEQVNIDTQRLETAASLLAHWLNQRPCPIDIHVVRDALRRFTSPWLLGDTALALLLFGGLPTAIARGAALQSLLHDLIERLVPHPGARPEDHRSYLITCQLYIERRMAQQISRELGLSQRQYQRCLAEALVRIKEMIADDR